MEIILKYNKHNSSSKNQNQKKKNTVPKTIKMSDPGANHPVWIRILLPSAHTRHTFRIYRTPLSIYM